MRRRNDDSVRADPHGLAPLGESDQKLDERIPFVGRASDTTLVRRSEAEIPSDNDSASFGLNQKTVFSSAAILDAVGLAADFVHPRGKPVGIRVMARGDPRRR